MLSATSPVASGRWLALHWLAHNVPGLVSRPSSMKFATVLNEASSNESDRTILTQLLDRSVADGRRAVTAGQIDCPTADRQLADLERSIAAPAQPRANGPAVGPALAAAGATATGSPAVRGVTDKEIRFGISAPFSGPAKELGRQMKLGIDTAFNRANEAGGVEGRMLKLIAADDGYEPTRTAETMKQLYDKDQVFGISRQCRHAHCGSGGALCSRAKDVVLRRLHRRQYFAARPTGPLRVQLPCKLHRRNRCGGALPR